MDKKIKESEILELKKSTSELKEAIVSIVAILNKSGRGGLYFGIKNNGEVIGQGINEKTIRDISKSISDAIEPKIFPKIEKIVVNEKECIKLEFEGRDIPYYAFGRAYIRVGDENKKISAKELEDKIIEKNKEALRWDNQICEKATLNDIDENTISKFIDLVRQSKRIKFSGETKKVLLEKLNLMHENKKLTNAAIILFGKNPSKFFDNSIIKCGRFKGDLKQEFYDLKDINENIFNGIEKSLEFLKDHMRVNAVIEGLYRKEKFEIPIEALREAIINALIHRDYSSSGFSYIKFYDDRLIIANPGKLPKEIKIKDLYKEHESIPKNPLLAKTIYYTGMIDVWGRGIGNIIENLESEGLEKPIFEESIGSFRIIFKRPKISDGVNGGVNGGVSLFEYIQKNPGKRTSQMINDLKIAKRTIERHLKKLKDEGKIEFRGSAKIGGYYVKK